MEHPTDPPPDHLGTVGWDARWHDEFVSAAAPGDIPGRVTRVDRGEADVVTAAGTLRVAYDRRIVPLGGLCTGDWVVVRDAATIAAVLTRRTALLRASVGGQSQAQALAANIDTVVVAVAADSALRLARVERLLTLAWESGAQPVVAVTKSDLLEPAADLVAQLHSSAPGVQVLAVSATTGAGIADLVAATSGTLVLVGPSGAGKSTLGNALAGQQVFASGEVREADHKGRHTTVTRELIALPAIGRALIDTPGLRAAAVWNAEEGMSKSFSDIDALAAQCRFDDCAHIGEPGCAVGRAIAAGELSERRLDSYHKLLRESERIAARSNARLRAEHTGHAKQMSRGLREHYRINGKRR